MVFIFPRMRLSNSMRSRYRYLYLLFTARLSLLNAMLKLLVVFTLCLLGPSASAGHPNPLDDDRSSLLLIKQKLGSLPAWNCTSSPCDWPQVNCTEHAAVVGLELRNATITEEILGWICGLPNLTDLRISDSHIPGGLLHILNHCPKLRKLHLPTNSLTGTIPGDVGRRLPHLEDLDLSSNFFSGDIPETFSNMRNLKLLNLARNKLNGTIPQGLLESKNLTHLLLSNNGLSGHIPSSVGAVQLKEIDLSHNFLTGPIPEGFSKLQNLTSFRLSMNQLSGRIPTNLTQIPSLQIFKVNGNNFTGGFPIP